jgi:hypothetical protein
VKNWDRSRAIVVFGVAALFAGVNCVAGASGWHGIGSVYHTTPFMECLTREFPILFVLVAVGLAWYTRNWIKL